MLMSPAQSNETRLDGSHYKRKRKCRRFFVILAILFATLFFYILWNGNIDEDADKVSSGFKEYAPAVNSVEDSDHSNSEPPLSFWHSSLSAAEKIQCQDSVLTYVTNATDMKDECEGLRKAFDVACSHDNARPTQDNGSEQKQMERKRRRLDELSTVANQFGLHYFNWHKLTMYVSKLYGTEINANELVSNEGQSKETLRQQKKWHDLTDEYEKRKPMKRSKKMIPSWDHLMDHRRLPENPAQIQMVNKTEFMGDDESNLGDGGDEIVQKPLSPSLPTTNEHVGDQMLNDAIAISDGKAEEIATAIKEMKNSTNSNSTKTENEVSAEAISTATAVVDAVLNSPESVEARKCCASIMNVFHEQCDTPVDDDYNDKKLFVIVSVIAICGIVKSLIRHYKLRWLPEAGGCILVGVMCGFFIQFLPNMDFGFQHDMFLRLMVPPIVFEAALNIDKRSFMRLSVPIAMYAVFGTLLSTLLTAAIIYYGTYYLGSWCVSIPFIESLVFGALISSIDPIAVLSVLSNLGMSDKDRIYVLIFGESLLNDVSNLSSLLFLPCA